MHQDKKENCLAVFHSGVDIRTARLETLRTESQFLTYLTVVQGPAETEYIAHKKAELN